MKRATLRGSGLCLVLSSRGTCWLLAAFLLLTAAGCSRQKNFTLATHQEKTLIARIGDDIADIVEKENGWKITVLSGPEYNFNANVSLVTEGVVDFAACVADLKAESSEVRTILEIYPEVLVVIYDKSLGNPASLEELLRGRRVGVGPRELPYSKYLLELINGFGVSEELFTPVYHPLNQFDFGPGKMDVLFTFMGANSEGLEKLITDNHRIYSFDDPGLHGHVSRVDGYLMKHPNVKSFVLPRNTFGKYPLNPVLTLAVPVTLIARKDMDEDVVYAFSRAVLESYSTLWRKNPVLGYLSQDLDSHKFNYPLHEGTRQYLHRDQPSLLERYAETLGFLLTVILLVVGGVGSIHQLLKKRKKDRIDKYYEKLLAYGKRTPAHRQDAEETLAELAELKNLAIQQLQTERLEANESFSIFINLLHYEMERMKRHRDAAGKPVS